MTNPNPTTPTGSGAPASGERFEGVVQVAIMLLIGTMAGAASFTHVHDVAVAHGQPDWIGWADAIVVELMSIALGLELRRRARTGRPTRFVLNSLVFFVAVSLAAQVVEAERSVIGWLAAALPAIGFLVLAKVVLSRTTTKAATGPTGDPMPANTPPEPASPATQPALTASATDPAPANPAAVNEAPRPQAPAHLLTPARFAVVNHQQTTGRPITADELATRMSLTPTIAGQLLAALQPDTPAAMPAARINGAPVAGGGAR